MTDQNGTVAVWQLLADGHSPGAIRHALRGLRTLHDGVYVSGHAAVTDHQRWKAATITAPHTALAEWSAAALHSLHDGRRDATTVVRPGKGPRVLIGAEMENRLEPLLVTRSRSLDRDLVSAHGIGATSPARTVLELVSRTSPERAARLVRDALRLKKATTADFRMMVGRHHGRRGVAQLRALVDEYAPLPLARTQSDAEGLALAILRAAGVEDPIANSYVEGYEADLYWPQHRLILELDGPQFHQFPSHDAKKQRAWERAGLTVRRLPTDDVYDRPHRLLELAPQPVGK